MDHYVYTVLDSILFRPCEDNNMYRTTLSVCSLANLLYIIILVLLYESEERLTSHKKNGASKLIAVYRTAAKYIHTYIIQVEPHTGDRHTLIRQ